MTHKIVLKSTIAFSSYRLIFNGNDPQRWNTNSHFDLQCMCMQFALSAPDTSHKPIMNTNLLPNLKFSYRQRYWVCGDMDKYRHIILLLVSHHASHTHAAKNNNIILNCTATLQIKCRDSPGHSTYSFVINEKKN